MNRRPLKLLSLWIVPLLIARAMIPAGYMLSTADGLQLLFCPSVVQAPTMTVAEHAGHMDHSAHAGHDMPQHAGHHAGNQDTAPATDTSHENSACPFSLVASAALLDVPFVAPAAVRSVDEIIDFHSGPAVSAAPQRIHRIRGPPRLS